LAGLRLSRRAFLRTCATWSAAWMVGACAPATNNFLSTGVDAAPAPAPTPTREAIQLVYQDWGADWLPNMVQEMLAQFHATQPDIRVFYTPAPDHPEDEMLAELNAGTAPDLLSGCCTVFPAWAQQGYLLDLRPYVAADLDAATIGDWDAAQYRAFFLRDGHQYGLPKYHGAVALYYNKDRFAEAAIADPTAAWTHDDYQAAMRKLSHNTGGDERDQWGSMMDIDWERVQIHVNSWGGHLVDPDDPAHCTADSPAALAALDWLRARMWDDRVMATYPVVQYMSPRSAFINQRVAMVEASSAVLKDILLNAPFRVGVVTMPSGPQQRVALATSDGFGIYARTEYAAAAWELMKFLTGPAYGLAMAKANLLQPARASLIDAWIAAVQAEFPTKAQELDLAVFADGQRKGDSVAVEIADNMAEVQLQMAAAFEKIFTLGQAPVGYLHSVCAQINAQQQRFDRGKPHSAE
jgi:ABC-type glycerol-3-phosphate transport system substrate-binding protein